MLQVINHIFGYTWKEQLDKSVFHYCMKQIEFINFK